MVSPRWRPVFLTALFVFTLVAGKGLRAEVKLPSIFGDHMVVQRNQSIIVWGWDAPRTQVKVALGGNQVLAKADSDGKFMARLPALKAGGPHTLTVEGTSTAAFKDVLVGEVWLCSGQSNMEWRVRQSNNPEQEQAAAKFPTIRHIKFEHRTAAKPLNDAFTKTGWEKTTPETVGNFTAVGYFFARNLQKELNVPIGLIGSNWGGTRIEPWTPPVGFKSVPELKESITDKLDSFPTRRGDQIVHQSPLAIYNAMIAPIVPYGIKGAIWYQGESNNGEGMLYHHKMKALIAGWRKIWNNPDLPFYFVQLAPYRYGGDPTRLPGIWEAQTATLKVPNTGMAVTVNIGNVRDIHPRNKQDVGKRLALWALAKNYGQDDLVYSGPLFKKMTVDGSKAVLHFDHVGDGLVSRDGKPLKGFMLAGKDKKFVEASAKIEGDTVVVTADGVSQPVAVRFGWHQEAEPNLSNKNGLPASPFRTDKW